MKYPSKNLPLVSICIPAYNGEMFIEHALKCAQEQTYPHIEIIVTDDCSADATLSIVKRIANTDNRIKVFSNSYNKGLTGNWNECVMKSNGEWVKFLFQDDIMNPECVELLVASAMNYEARVCISSRRFIIGNNAHPAVKHFFEYDVIKPEHLLTKKVFYTSAEMMDILTPFLHLNVLGEPSTWLLHKTIFTGGATFNPRMQQLVDYEFLMNCVFKYGLVFVNSELVCFRVHGASASNSNADNTDDIRSIKRNIQANAGDYLEIITDAVILPLWKQLFLNWGNYRLKVMYERIYFKACKNYGEQITNEALHATLCKAPYPLKPYNLFRYTLNKIQYRWFVAAKLHQKVTD